MRKAQDFSVKMQSMADGKITSIKAVHFNEKRAYVFGLVTPADPDDPEAMRAIQRAVAAAFQAKDVLALDQPWCILEAGGEALANAARRVRERVGSGREVPVIEQGGAAPEPPLAVEIPNSVARNLPDSVAARLKKLTILPDDVQRVVKAMPLNRKMLLGDVVKKAHLEQAKVRVIVEYLSWLKVIEKESPHPRRIELKRHAELPKDLAEKWGLVARIPEPMPTDGLQIIAEDMRALAETIH